MRLCLPTPNEFQIIQLRKLVDAVEVPSGRCSFDCLYFCWRHGLPRDAVRPRGR